jgi:hypothetical protein
VSLKRHKMMQRWPARMRPLEAHIDGLVAEFGKLPFRAGIPEVLASAQRVSCRVASHQRVAMMRS